LTYGLPTPQGTCNENQFSDPFVGPDGNVYVAFANFNDASAAGSAGGGDGGDNGGGGGNAPSVNAVDNHYQMLLVKSTDGGATFGAPVLVGSYYDLPDCATYQNGQDSFRACVPEKGSTANSYFRATNYPSGAVNPTNAQQVVITYGSYINRDSNTANGCVPQGFSTSTGIPLYTGVKTPGSCNNDIVLSVSNDAGATFTGTTTDVRFMPVVTTGAAQATTDQYFQWEAFTTNGRLVVSYYDRQYGSDEINGSSDVSLSTWSSTAGTKVQRVTTGSLPPPTQFSGLFYGDYAGVTAVTNALPLWSDTRIDELFLCAGTGVPGVPPALCTGTATNASVANDQNAFAARVEP
jgi:hypothetical protein